MSDKDKATPSDGPSEEEKKPMKDPAVVVRAHPVRRRISKRAPPEEKRQARRQNEENEELAGKVERALEKEIRHKVGEAGTKPGATREDQYDAADDAAKEAASQTSRRKINKIDYGVGDKGGIHEGEVTPEEGAPPDDEE